MALCTSDKKALKWSTCGLDLVNIKLDFDWEDVTCSICLEFPHNGVLLWCSSHDKGCRPFMCDTDQNHSNCLERFKSAYGVPAVVEVPSGPNGVSVMFIQGTSSSSSSLPTCPLCRGDVTGWLIIDDARFYLNMKKRCCEEKHCTYVGNFYKLQKHARRKHPHSRPSEIDPAQKLKWEKFQQSSDMIDVLSIIHSEVPHAVILGDYVIEYEDSEIGDEYEEFRRNRGKWWTSLLCCKLFLSFRGLRNRRRSRRRVRSNRWSNYDVGEDSSRSVDIRDYRFPETAVQFEGTTVGGATRSVDTRDYRFAETNDELARPAASGAIRPVELRDYRFAETNDEPVRTAVGAATSLATPNHNRYGMYDYHFYY
ncbi:hypothetical protein MUK42_19802 [Musa troglodytarum]|uniref:Uncharacterized protein n=1 Tax=Musa troglodytarum TaxID=320322 RepID=A0A9E7G250_9LILI|nr:hypothetical protein MUK42_19802 [Musa troglodytarum]URE04161.1 hypothetical protein MUK42_19802 [Musa troglodytarum]URE04162.1 hypothetical protein MUK42_19802 [Musa troglodytarum]URE04163.1 hypothetical protein MUK42_19802 [Musa troglodytarum]URE04164.1 hypothetical protein MUK42_19802 [Musa troglodytarum]